MFRKLRGTIYFSASGQKIYNFINEIRDNGIVCTGQRCKNDEYYGQVYALSYPKICEIAKTYNIEITENRRKGFVFKAIKYRFRYGLLAGAFLAIAFVFYVSNIVINIDVNGNEKIPTEQILSVLDDIGISKGKLIQKIDFSSSEKKLRLCIGDVAWVGIRHTGCRIVVDVDEIVEAPKMIANSIPCNIIANKDAQIKSIKVYNGYLQYAVGDGVKKGDVLISGIVPDTKGNIRKLHALGEIIGTYKDEKVFTQYFGEDKRLKDGDQTVKKYLDFFSMRIPLFFGNIEMKDYEYDEQKSNFMLLGKELPIGLIYSYYQPYSEQKVSYTKEEAEWELISKINLYESNFLSDASIISRDIIKNVYDDRVEYTVKYNLEGNIGTSSEVYVK